MKLTHTPQPPAKGSIIIEFLASALKGGVAYKHKVTHLAIISISESVSITERDFSNIRDEVQSTTPHIKGLNEDSMYTANVECGGNVSRKKWRVVSIEEVTIKTRCVFLADGEPTF